MEERWISILLEQQGTWRILGIASRKEMWGLIKKRSQSSSDPLERAGSRTQHRILNHWCHDRLSHTMPKPRKCFYLWHSLERGQKTCRKRRLERIEQVLPDTTGWQHSWIHGICGFLNKSNPISMLAWRTRSPQDPPLRSYRQMIITGKLTTRHWIAKDI